jgi:hypothetical protein
MVASNRIGATTYTVVVLVCNMPKHTRHLSDDLPTSLIICIVPVLRSVRIGMAIIRYVRNIKHTSSD